MLESTPVNQVNQPSFVKQHGFGVAILVLIVTLAVAGWQALGNLSRDVETIQSNVQSLEEATKTNTTRIQDVERDFRQIRDEIN